MVELLGKTERALLKFEEFAGFCLSRSTYSPPPAVKCSSNT